MSWFNRFFEFEEEGGGRGGSKFDRVHEHLKVSQTRNGSCVMTVARTGKQFWVGR